MSTAKVFWTGRSQAVRLPKEFRLNVDEVEVTRQGDGLVLKPLGGGWRWLEKLTGAVDEDFAAAAEEDVASQERPDLDVFR